MRRAIVAGLALCLLATVPDAGAQQHTKQVQFAHGTSGTTLQDRVTGDDGLDYRLSLRSGQPLSVVLHSHNSSLYFNVIAPAAQEAMFVGSLSGNRFSGTVPASGDYTIRVYLMRNAARRGETAAFTLDVRADPVHGAAGATPAPDRLAQGIVPGDLADLVGARGSSGETQLSARGYASARTQGLTHYWWHGASQSCVRVVTADGRYASILAAPNAACGH
ncbi:hypothetical protein HB662_06310 [Roseomonas frigidaquae]|uniref:Inhibitor of g-type lysozyme n=1 Tax=Falsiroseomonas frigidaquae TaxID=487318 RepID=A0ABX1EV31_9PROT|nr:hypothetical protein [Falsiroseomonas frigidaquae]NKE44383.1 hypothetical protein [Falsiroseomonas frigidaquae]